MDPEIVRENYAGPEYGPAPEGAGPALEWLQSHECVLSHFIGGRWVRSENTLETHNPATGDRLASFGCGSREDIHSAVEAAKAAHPDWAALSGHERAKYLYAMARHIQKNSRLFATLETLDNGKPIRETRDIDIPLAIRHFYHHAGWAELSETEFGYYQPVGVIGQIIPWNFPLMMLAWKVAPALAMGNTVVLKPAEQTPLTALLFAELCQSIGLPPGVVNIVTGDGSTGEALVNHPDVNKIAFTGSTEVGRRIRQATAGTGKRVSLELGGKSPFLVFEDADLDSAVEGLVDAIWFNQGQVCCAGSRLLVQEPVAERVLSKVKARMESLRVGNPLDKAIDIGAIISPEQLARIETLVNQGIKEGAHAWRTSKNCPAIGNYYPPTLITQVSPSSTLAQEEIFGPVLVVMSFRTLEEGVELANNTRYGLAASVWTENIGLALDIAPKLAAGTVWINCTNQFDAASGFGGVRESGFGREGGREGLFEYLRPKRPHSVRSSNSIEAAAMQSSGEAGLDRTAKLFIGGKQVRPDGGYSYSVYSRLGTVLGEAGLGNRKDIRNAVESAHKAMSWSRSTGHARAQILYYLAENLTVREGEFAERLASWHGSLEEAQAEVSAAVQRLCQWAAWADKYDGAAHSTQSGFTTLAMNEPVGVVGIVCPNEQPLLSLVHLAAGAVSQGNRVIVIPSQSFPFPGTDFYQVLETSDVPDGVINLITGDSKELSLTLAAHDDVQAVWYFRGDEGEPGVQQRAAGNLKRTWMGTPEAIPASLCRMSSAELLRESTQVKNIWIPYASGIPER